MNGRPRTGVFDPARSRLVEEVLDEYGAATRRLLGRYLPEREPRRYLYDLAAEYPRRGGKMMRPSLLIATAQAFGGRLEEAVRSAVAVELLHNALLIHDDIEDDSLERRGRPTLHVEHGVPIAVNVGDALTLLSLRPLIENRAAVGPWLAMRILEETERMARESAEGQASELGWIRDNAADLDDADYLRMVLKKTCWLAAIHPLRVGALIGTGGAVDPDDFVRLGFFLGAAFQIHDDILNLVGETARYGKEPDGDLREGKRTLMLLRLRRVSTPREQARLAALLARPRHRRRAADVRWIRRRMEHYGCIEHARQIAHGLAGAALHEFSLVFSQLPDSRDKRFIEALVTWMLERTH